jgi:hypothetical protein
MGVDKVIQSLRVKLIYNTANKVANLPIATHLSWQPALKATPLTINVVRPFELRTIPFNTGLGLYVDRSQHLLRLK